MPMKQIFNIEDIEKKILLILRILHESPEPVGARIISRRMQEHGVTLSERGGPLPSQADGRPRPHPAHRPA